ncbi:ComF family protein [Cyanobium sp. CH-040]|uniref:ComF family protein n=1 Tax=Cyanobium sp. CH-040 TaxID=2823708 RepID=UPI0020CD9457|nr:phosphoribosyltransferase family protein [Cyanobium sp. CH-040]MCP9929120.1 ComF family protein [Cyanobium sp. CH-040]
MPNLIPSPAPLASALPPPEHGSHGPESARGRRLFRLDPLRLLPLEWLLQPPAGAALQLPPQGMTGLEPLPWWSAGPYADGLRLHLLALRRQPRSQNLRPLLPGLVAQLRQLPRTGQPAGPPLLVAVPSWKRQANPLPPLLAAVLSQQLDWPQRPLLARSRPVLGQHRLDRDLRWQNQQGAFRCLQRPTGARRDVVLLDDILTTGATACAAAAALRERGWRVLGMACVARTPAARGQRSVGAPAVI